MISSKISLLLVCTNVLWISARAAQWSDWSGWSECSRTCDGGASYQLRQCRKPGHCRGDSIRYRTCNIEPCPARSRDFREEQCATYNDVPYNGKLWEWQPYHQVNDPCSLKCKAKGERLVVQMAPQVLDGTRCDTHSKNMCINGRCMTVGCDNVLSSNQKLDDCGVCGGDGSSCRDSTLQVTSLYVWEESAFSECSVTCGVGEQMTAVYCKDLRTGKTISPYYCQDRAPSRRAKTCLKPQCIKPVWITALWNDCSKSCGGGTSRRNIYCVKENVEGGFQRTENQYCTDPRPVTERRCNDHDCPRWYAGSWSPCSVTCESGYQYRDVICRRTEQHGCSAHDQPVTSRVCEAGISCLGQKALQEIGHNETDKRAFHSQITSKDVPSRTLDRDLNQTPKSDSTERWISKHEREMEEEEEAVEREEDEDRALEVGTEHAEEEGEVGGQDNKRLPHGKKDGEAKDGSNETRERGTSDERRRKFVIDTPLPDDSHRLPFVEPEIQFESFPWTGAARHAQRPWQENTVYDTVTGYETNSIEEAPVPGVPFDPYLSYHKQYKQEVALNGVEPGRYNPDIDDPRHDFRGNEVMEANRDEVGLGAEVDIGDIRPTDPDDVEPEETDDVKPTDPDDVKPTDADDVKPTYPDDVKPTDPDDVKPTDPDDVKPEDTDDVRPTDPDDVKPEETDDVWPEDYDDDYDEDYDDDWTEDTDYEWAEDTDDVEPEDLDNFRPEVTDVRPGDPDTIDVDPGKDGFDSSKKHQISTKPGFVVTSWDKCSKTCGRGIQRRRVHCKVFLEFTRQIQDLPDEQCPGGPGKRPPESQPCMIRECREGADVDIDELFNSYYWEFMGYNECSATCLGGIEEPTFKCIRQRDHAYVDSQFCSSLILPPRATRVCNDVPCPPIWQAGAYGACSEKCGGGYQWRKVECIQNLSSRYGDFAVLSDSDCRAQIPTRTRPCNPGDCDPKWVTPDWSECSVTCGTGIHTRQVLCQQVVGGGNHVKTLPNQACTDQRPPAQQRCYRDPCPTQAPLSSLRIEIDPSTFIQTRKRKNIMLNVGGNATLIHRTSLSVRCSVKHFNRKNINWMVNGNIIPREGRIKVTKKGVLRLRNTKNIDKGVYTCLAGRGISANFELSFHSTRESNRAYTERTNMVGRHIDFIVRLHQLRKEKGKKDEITLPILLGSMSMSEIPFYFNAGDWEECSKSCGGAGLQHRAITCEVVMENYYLVVDDSYCLRDETHMKPLETRDCGFHRCPTWQVGDWTKCSDSTCLRNGQGAIKRPLYCISHNGTTLDHHHCDKYTKPEHKQPCVHQGCHATWRVSNWTKCSKSCGGEGLQKRALQCIWVSNKHPAGIHCSGQAKPPVVKPCQTSPCIITACRDRSTFCSLIPQLNMCHMPEYQRQCCHSCTQNNGRRH